MANLLTRQEIEQELRRAFPPEQTATLVQVINPLHEVEVRRAADTAEIRQGLATLTNRVERLAAVVERLAQGQQDLTQAQQRTEERVEQLAQGQQELTRAQQRTEERVEQLAQITAELGKAITELTKVQQRAEIGLYNLDKSVGSLAHTFGFSFEEFVAALLPPYLEIKHGISKVIFEKTFLQVGEGQLEEVDLFGTGVRDGKTITLLVECKTSIGGGETRRLANKLDALAASLGDGAILKIIVAMNVHPSAAEAAIERGLELIPYSRIHRGVG